MCQLQLVWNDHLNNRIFLTDMGLRKFSEEFRLILNTMKVNILGKTYLFKCWYLFKHLIEKSRFICYSIE